MNTHVGHHTSFGLLSLAVHGALLALVAGVVLHQPAVRQIMRVTLVSPGDGRPGAGSAAAPAPAVSPPAPAAPMPARAAAPPPVAPPRQRAAVKVTRHLVRPSDPPAAVAPALPEVAGSAPAAGDDASGVAAAGSAVGAGAPGAGGGGTGSGTGGHDGALERYLGAVRRRIEAAKVYPAAARRSRIEGHVAVSFEVAPDGSLRRLAVTSADHPLLGAAAQRAVEAAAPFPHWPTEITLPGLRIDLPLRFSLRDEEEEEPCGSACDHTP